MYTLRNNIQFSKIVVSDDRPMGSTHIRVIYDIEIDGWAIEIENSEVCLFSKWCDTLEDAIEKINYQLDCASSNDVPQDVKDAAHEYIYNVKSHCTKTPCLWKTKL